MVMDSQFIMQIWMDKTIMVFVTVSIYFNGGGIFGTTKTGI
jgi:hypothetical protein